MKSLRFFILVLSFNLNAQNLVPNYSFENCDLDGWLNSGLLKDLGIPKVDMMKIDNDISGNAIGPSFNTYDNNGFENSIRKDTIKTQNKHELFIEALGPGGHGSLGYSYVINK